MPRSGGESDKLGNRYEGIWTVQQLLDLAAGKFEAVTVEPIDDSLGIEFVVTHFDGVREFHSAKRQNAKGEWTLPTLSKPNKSTGRSILTDLCGKLATDGKRNCVFVSSSGATDFLALTNKAQQHKEFADFQAALRHKSGDRIRGLFEKHVLPMATNWEGGHFYLQHLRVVIIDEDSLKKQVDQYAAFLTYKPRPEMIAVGEVRILLGDFILEHLGSEIRQDQIWRYLAESGFAHRDWIADRTIRDIVDRLNRSYKRTVETDLVNGSRIPRPEADAIVTRLVQPNGAKNLLVTAAAGMGKSCVLAQAAVLLETRNVPNLVIRMDRHGEAYTTRDIGRQMGLPQSPVVVLAGIANGAESVLFVDQLDAASQISGRYPHLWEVFDELRVETEAYPNMRVVIACREFDLQHDHRLRRLKSKMSEDQIYVAKIAFEIVDEILTAAGCPKDRFTSGQKEILQSPLHLFLLLNSLGDDCEAEVRFATISDLFDRVP